MKNGMQCVLLEQGKWYLFQSKRDLDEAVERYNAGQNLTGWSDSGNMSKNMDENAKAWYIAVLI